MAYTAEIRRVGGSLYKAARGSSNLFLPDTCFSNTTTFFRAWPKKRGSFLMYGRSVHTQRREVTEALLMQQPMETAADKSGAARPQRSGFMKSLARGLPPEPKAAERPAKSPVKVGLRQLRQKYEQQEPISMVTAYDYPSARLGDAAGADMLLVGDSVGMVVLGQEDTTEVTMEMMVHHCAATARGVSKAFLVGDLPFGSCLTPEEAASNSVRLVKEGRVGAVKIEGGTRVLPHIRAIVDAGVAVMGHLGLTPQSYTALGGFCVQGRSAEAAHALLEEAKLLEEAGCFALVLEMVPEPVAREITRQINIPTIGIGAGAATSGQVQVFHDLLGLYDKKVPRFSHQFARLEGPMTAALHEYVRAVKTRGFPQPRHAFSMPKTELLAFEQASDATAAPDAPPRAMAAHAGVAPSRTRVVRTVEEWRNLQAEGLVPQGASVGLVPTMGALHEGHLSLVRLARRDNDLVAASVFVNPKQFAPGEDLEAYPAHGTWEADLAALEAAGVDLVYAPSAEAMYPRGSGVMTPFVDLVGVDTAGEGASRPGFFRGVATVVSKLLNIVQPTALYLGQKDGLQCVVVSNLIDELNFPTRLVVGPTMREPDGLAMSSRNVYLDATQRAVAPAVYAALCKLQDVHGLGERDPEALRGAAAAVIAREPLMTLEYVSLADTADGQELGARLGGEDALVSIAVRLGEVKLIDNVLLASD